MSDRQHPPNVRNHADMSGRASSSLSANAAALVAVTMKILRVYHAGRDPRHRQRERALVAAGLDVTLVVPCSWPDEGAEAQLSEERFRVVELPVRRAGDVNRHVYVDNGALSRLIDEVRPDVIDIHEEPFAAVTRQWLRALRSDSSVVMYTAQNIDKRFPPPFLATSALRTSGLQPSTRAAAKPRRCFAARGSPERSRCCHWATTTRCSSQDASHWTLPRSCSCLLDA